MEAQPELKGGLKQHAGSMADVIAFADSRGYSFAVEEAKQYAVITDAVALDHIQLDVVTGGALNPASPGRHK